MVVFKTKVHGLENTIKCKTLLPSSVTRVGAKDQGSVLNGKRFVVFLMSSRESKKSIHRVRKGCT